jgi:DNA primase
LLLKKRKIINQLKFNNMNAKQAKQIKIADYLHSLGYNPAEIQRYNYWYRSPCREERTASFKVDTTKNTWRDFGTGESGDIIDLAQKIGNCTVETALRNLANVSAYVHTGNSADIQSDSSFFHSKNVSQNNPTTIITDIRSIAHPKLIEWVQERKIDLHLTNLYCREIHYQNQYGQFFSVGFRNDKGGYELNSPPSFKSCISPKEITTFQNEKDSCLVFEGVWDFLSYLTIQKIERTKHDVAVLNSTANTEKAMSFLKTHKEIYTYLDNDDAGRKATELIKSANLTVYNRSTHFDEYKDLNDFLTGKKQEQAKVKRKGLRM